MDLRTFMRNGIETLLEWLSAAASMAVRLWKDRRGRRVILFCAALLALLLFLLIYQPFHRRSVRLEAGSPLPSAAEVTGQSDAYYLDEGEVDLSVPGVYKTKLKCGKGTYYLRVKVVDTVAPTATPVARNWGLGTPFPDAAEFVTDIVDASEVTVSYVNADNDYSALSTYPIEVKLTDLGGNETSYKTTVTLVYDTEAPVIKVEDVVGYLGYGIAYAKGAILSDNCCGEIVLSWDSSKVDTEKVGEYPVYYTATDASGNTARAEGKVYIYEEEVSKEKLFVKIDRILEELVTVDMDIVERLRRVYDYVYDHIAYVGTSDKSDWVREAYRALEEGAGDCFSYFALAKAFFERMGLENMDIERTPGLTDERHYWNFVNIGTEEDPKWYYFDATHINTTNSGGEHSGCLLTEKQIMAFNHFKAHFYTFDHTGYPAAATEIVTPTPKLEPYY